MIIGIDARFAVHNRRGIGNYTLMLIQNLVECVSEHVFILYIDKEDSEKVLPIRANVRIKILTPSNYFIWEQIILPLQAMKDGVELLHCTGNTAPILVAKHIKLVATVHDVIYLKKTSIVPKPKSMYQKLGKLYRKIIVPLMFRRVDAIITVSNYSKIDIQEHFPLFPSEKLHVIHEAANETFKIQNNKEAQNQFDYILTLGAIDNRKNTEMVIRKYIELKRETNIVEKLIVVGIPNWKQTKFQSIVENSGFQKDIIFTAFVSEEELVTLYNNAKIFVYPSLYEGFGLPPLEAMSCGTPVITSMVTSIPEIVGGAAILIDPNSGEELKQAIKVLLVDDKLRSKLIQDGLEQVNQFSWSKMASETMEIYNTLF